MRREGIRLIAMDFWGRRVPVGRTSDHRVQRPVSRHERGLAVAKLAEDKKQEEQTNNVNYVHASTIRGLGHPARNLWMGISQRKSAALQERTYVPMPGG